MMGRRAALCVKIRERDSDSIKVDLNGEESDAVGARLSFRRVIEY